ncbi:MAG: TonB-dependent receptor domain-containing protein [Candidatus Acidiferrales bacterium]
MQRGLVRIVILALVVALALGATVSLWAQSISGVIAGVVNDPQGAALAAVSITVTNRATGRNYVASTDAQGYYRVPEITPGEYEVTAELGGFQTEKHTGVYVSVNRLTVENFTLQIPPKVEVVEVISKAPMTDTTGPTLSTAFPERQLTDLPILTRDINNLALLAPGVASVRTFSFASTLVPFSVNGSRGRFNNFIIDSVDNNEPLFGGGATQFTNTDIFAEYAILTHQFKAEFGRNSGGTVNVITKSGSNLRHGSLFWFGQNDAFNARNQVEKQALLGKTAESYENQIGGTLGGALAKDKAFYFLSYQWDRARTNLSNVFPVISTLPTLNGLATLQSLPATPGRDALLASPTVQVVPGLDAPCFSSQPPTDPTARTTNPCYPPVSVIPLGVEYGAFLIPNANIFDVRDHQASARFDFRFSNTDDFYGRYLIDDLAAPRSVLAPAGEAAFSDLGLLPEYRSLLRQRTQSLLLSERHYFVNALNEFRFSFTRISQGIGAFNVPEDIRELRPSASVFDDFGAFGSFQGSFPAAGQQFTLGRDSRPTLAASNVFQIQDNYSFNFGRHSMKVGLNWVRTQSNIRSIPSDLGQYFYGDPLFVIRGLDDFLQSPSRPLVAFQRFANVITDSAGNIIGQGQDELPLREFDQFYFFQDDFRVTPKFTLSAGLRYEQYSQPLNGIRGLNPNGPKVSVDRNNFAPRLGFAWAPWARTVFRGGYGIHYNPMALNIALLIWQSGPISPVFVSDTIGISYWQPTGDFPGQPFSQADLLRGDDPLGLIPAGLNTRVADCSSWFFRVQAYPGDPYQNPGLPDIPFPGSRSIPLLNCSNQDLVDSDLVNPYVQHFSLSMQQELTPNLLLEFGYAGSKGTKLYQRVDENPFCFEGDPSCFVCTDPGSFFCQFPALNFREDPTRGAVTRVNNAGRSTYHAFQMSLTRRLSHFHWGDLSFTSAYTWSHLIDTTSEIFGPSVRLIRGDLLSLLTDPLLSLEGVEAITPLAQDHRNLEADKGNSSFDRRHRLAMSFLWDIAPRSGFWKGGWQLSGIFAAQSGQPFTPLNGFGACIDYNGDGRFTTDRPSVGDPNAPVRSVALLRDPNCFDPLAGYEDLNGDPIDPMTARFVQTPIGLRPGDPFSVGTGTLIAGSAGRNVLTGPGIVNMDLGIFKNFRWGESKVLQFRWEIYDLFNHPNPGFGIGNVFATDAQPTPGFAFFPSATPARVTGVIPENLISATDQATSEHTFLSTQFMNTSSRRMQFGLRFIF